MLKPDGMHWSASRFMLFSQCPRLYKSRYIDGVVSEPSLAMLFGKATHTALEAMHQGHRGTCLAGCADAGHRGLADPEARYTVGRTQFASEYAGLSETLEQVGLLAPAALYASGLRMLNQVAELGLNADGSSTAERWFSLPTRETLGFPTIGAIDLWSPPDSQHGAVVWDFKTTAGAWGTARAEREMWQPLLYTWAYRLVYDVIPVFKYVVLNRIQGTCEIFARTWTPRAWQDDLNGLMFQAEEIAEAVIDGNFECTRGHGTCLECGQPFGHDHVCADASRSARIKLGRHREPVPLRADQQVVTLDGTAWVQPSLTMR